MPQLSVVLSGTPGQVEGLIKSAEDGLVSRFLFYNFKSSIEWRDAGPTQGGVNLTHNFDVLSEEVLRLAGYLETNSEANFHLSKEQWQLLNEFGRESIGDVTCFVSEEMSSTAKHFGTILFWQQYRQAMQWLRGKLNVRYDIEGQGGGPRKEHWEIPETVFKDAIINALSHRDYYEKGAVIHIEVFEDRVEISNPGGLVSAISESDFGKKSHSRNLLIFGLFARMHLVEQVGSGIGRIQELMEKAGLPEASFRKEGMFTVILQRPPDSAATDDEKSREKGREKMLELIQQNPSITMKDLAEHLGRSPKSIEKQIRLLKAEGILTRRGPDRGGQWQVRQD